MSSHVSLSAVIPHTGSGRRLDQVAADLFPDYSRASLQAWIRSGELTLDGRTVKPNQKVCGGEEVLLEAEAHEEGDWEAEDIPLDIVYEDADILVISKPPGLVVHPAAGNWTGTLLNGLLHFDPKLRQVPRAGIVHRLDKDTSGLMVVARNEIAQGNLVEQLQARTVSRIYHALVQGESGEGEVDAPIGRHPTQRVKMAVVDSGKPALTRYRTLETFDGFTFLELSLATGRTHQIRVHMAHLGFPLVGDPVYGRKYARSQINRCEALKSVDDFPRQALHAQKLGLIHPKTQEEKSWATTVPVDFDDLLIHIREHFS